MWPITTPDRRGHRDAHLWRIARLDSLPVGGSALLSRRGEHSTVLLVGDEVRSAAYMTFTSSSPLFLLDALGADEPGRAGRLFSVGPVTSGALRERGLEPGVQAARRIVDELVDRLAADYLAFAR